MLGQKISFSIKKIKITQSVFFDHKGIKVENWQIHKYYVEIKQHSLK